MWRDKAQFYREQALGATSQVTRDMLSALAREADGLAQEEEEEGMKEKRLPSLKLKGPPQPG
jgi:hypothetical protein